MVFTNTYAYTWVVFSTTLTNKDIACKGILTAINFDPQTFAVRFSTVSRATDSFLMCHELILFNYVFNHNLGKLLTVTVQLLITFSSLLFEDKNFVSFNLL